MTTANSIIDEINRLMVIAFPSAQAHINACPKDFERPAYLIRCVSFDRTDANRWTVAVSAAFEIIYLPMLDKNQIVDGAELLTAQDAILGMLAAGFIKVGDRCLKIKSTPGKPETDGTIITIRTDYYDDRPAAADNTPKMGTVETTTKLD
ncbi:MAG: hypothetical protein CVU91_13415 [Firmicutes bacterium HGW-Firmicutes-16]|nr:MAG: hypothetical protein CVU91_13415 [Firmicutes bacterium HGW-Firmicutes-16]